MITQTEFLDGAVTLVGGEKDGVMVDGFKEDAMNDEAIHLQGEVTKVDKDRQLVFGWASIVEKGGKAVSDLQGDEISEEELEKAAYSYVLESRLGGEMHKRTKGVGRIVESIVFTKEKQDALGIDLGKSGWWIGFKIDDTEVWKKVKDGTYPMFSIHGRGNRKKV